MSAFIVWLLIGLVVLLVGLCVAVAVVVARLGRELRQLGDDTETMAARVQRAAQTAQAIVPLVALAQRAIARLRPKTKEKSERGNNNE